MSEPNIVDVAVEYDAAPFRSLVSLRQAHTDLLKRHRELGDAPELMVDVADFIEQGRTTGTLLDARDDRWDAQSILDYWVAVLYRARFKEPPDATLADPDPSQIPELTESQFPYPGLAALREDDRQDFLGRQELVAEMLDHLKNSHLLAVVGPAAGGKSSLVMAGILPALRSGAVPGSEAWNYYLPMVPGSNPLAALVQLLQLEDMDYHVERFSKDPEHLTRLVAERPSPALLIVDQFEELFTWCHDVQVREAFIANLASLISSSGQRHTVIVIMDTEFEDLLRTGLGDDARGHRSSFQSLYKRARKRVTAFSAAELRTLIRQPADLAGLRFDEGVVDALIQNVLGEPAAPLLLQFVLRKLWQVRDRNRVSWEAYKHLAGEGYRKLLARTAEEFYQTLNGAEQETAKHILLQMIGFSESLKATSRRVRWETLYQLGQPRHRVDRVLDGLVKQGLVRVIAGGQPRATQVQTIHDSLAHEWRRLNDWLKEGWEDRRWRQRLTAAARQWAATGRDDGVLWRRIGWLEEVKDHEELDELEKDFIQESHKAIQREEERKLASERAKVWRQRSAVLLVLLLLTATALIVAWTQFRAAKREYDRAEQQLRLSTARKLGYAAAFKLDRDPELGILLATHAVSTTRDAGEAVTYEAENALHWALTASRVELTLFDEVAAMRDVAFSPDGQTLVTADLTGKVVAWDATSGERKRIFSSGGGVVYDVAFSPDGSRLVAAGNLGPVRVWNLDADSRPLTLSGPEGTVRAVAFSPNGEWLATAGFDTTAEIWHLDTEDAPLVLAGHTEAVNRVAFSPDGALVATTSDDKTARVWSAVDGTLVITLTGHLNDVYGLAFSPDGSYLVTASRDNTVKIWETDTGKEVCTLKGHTNSVVDVAVHGPPGSSWEPGPCDCTNSVLDVAVHESWLATASADRTAKVWDARTGEELFTLLGHTAPILRLAFSSDGRRLATASEDHTTRVWTLDPSREWLTLDHGNEIESAVFSPDGRWLVTAGKDKTAKVWDATSGGLLFSLSGHEAPIVDVAFDEKGERLATISRDGVAIVWDAATGVRQDRFSGYGGKPLGIAFIPGGLRLATAGEDGMVAVWGDDPGQPLLSLAGDKVTDVSFSSDGKLVATAQEDNRVRVWDATSGELVSDVGPPGRTRYFGVALSPDGTRVAAGGEDGLAKIWDVESEEVLRILQGHTNTVRDVAFSPDGSKLATASFDRTVRVWDVATGEELLFLPDHTDRVWSIAFSPDGSRLVSASLDGTARVYLLDMDELMSLACDRVTRNLTLREWQTYIGDEETYNRTCPGLPAHHTVVTHLQAEGFRLLREEEFDAALEVLRRAHGLDPTQEFVPEVIVAQELARQGEIDAALEMIAQARELNPTLEIVPEEIVAREIIGLAERRANEKDYEGALSAFRQAVELDPSLDMMPEIEVAKAQAWHYANEGQAERAIDTLLQAAERYPDHRWDMAWTLVQGAEGMALQGKYEAALAFLYAAADLESTVESMRAVEVYDLLCWRGCFDDQAGLVLPACEQAVELDPEHGAYRASRGLARALTGDLAGAAEDFRFFLEWEKGLPEDDVRRYLVWETGLSETVLRYRIRQEGASEERRHEFEIWLQALEAGQNPFDAATLEELRQEQLSREPIPLPLPKE